MEKQSWHPPPPPPQRSPTPAGHGSSSQPAAPRPHRRRLLPPRRLRLLLLLLLLLLCLLPSPGAPAALRRGRSRCGGGEGGGGGGGGGGRLRPRSAGSATAAPGWCWLPVNSIPRGEKSKPNLIFLSQTSPLPPGFVENQLSKSLGRWSGQAGAPAIVPAPLGRATKLLRTPLGPGSRGKLGFGSGSISVP
ncbi:retinoic acid-induced protein 1-like isoform X1 [Aquila chrysaetos chrysaetos]|uniref:retinoic acid-induced protein 1-like isoform X1 n=1 Tax=Aquila chrysaetos chrysaetos TaxID=223781 RepID=UPI001176DF5B|nr:retinoic acid-induced protein 1-like isoform X1 [Aquila chrysaetos chrysaetos]